MQKDMGCVRGGSWWKLGRGDTVTSLVAIDWVSTCCDGTQIAAYMSRTAQQSACTFYDVIAITFYTIQLIRFICDLCAPIYPSLPDLPPPLRPSTSLSLSLPTQQMSCKAFVPYFPTSFTSSHSLSRADLNLHPRRRSLPPKTRPTLSTVVSTVRTGTSNAPEFSDSPLAASKEAKRTPKVKLPIVAVVGRPNVGKSTLVNRLAGTFRNGAIVEDVIGITRDRTYRPTSWNGYSFQIVDTGGLVFDDESMYFPEIRSQALVAIKQATAVILCVNGQEGVNPLDEELAAFLRREVHNVPIFIAVNKCESDAGSIMAADFWALGIAEPFPVSAIHGSGTGDLLDRVVEELPLVKGEVEEDVVNVAIVGRPNVGKSSLLNVLVGEQRAIVSDVPGTTRDAIDEIITVHGKRYRLIDTAGIRRKTSVAYGTEFFMVNRAFKAIRRADIVLLMMDINEASEQDRKIADRIADEGKACIVLANKWDLVSEKTDKSYKDAIEEVRNRAVRIPWAPVELVSVVEKKRIAKIITMVDESVKQHRRRVTTSLLNEVLAEAVKWHKPPSTRGGKQGRIYYCTQVSIRPPTIALFVNDPKLFQDNYRRYMENHFRKDLGFVGTPVRLVWRAKSRAPSIG